MSEVDGDKDAKGATGVKGVSAHAVERWLVPIAIIAFCVAAFWISTTFKDMPPILKRGIQPSDFPQLVLVLVILLTVAMSVLDPVRIHEKLNRTTVGTLALFAVFSALTLVDFFLALGVFATGLAFIWGERRYLRLALVGLFVPLAVFFLFDQVFEIRFPRGALTNIWYG